MSSAFLIALLSFTTAQPPAGRQNATIAARSVRVCDSVCASRACRRFCREQFDDLHRWRFARPQDSVEHGDRKKPAVTPGSEALWREFAEVLALDDEAAAWETEQDQRAREGEIDGEGDEVC